MDVVMATGPPHKRDLAWATTDLRRSSSTNTHTEQNSLTLQQRPPPYVWQQIHATNSHQLSLTAQNVDMHNPPALSERWIANMQRWSGSTHSRSSTPDTIIWKDGISRPSSLIQDFSAAPDSPLSKTTSPPTTPSPYISPLQTPTLPPEDLSSSSSLLTLSTHQQKDSLVSLPQPIPLLSPLQAHTSSPLPSNSPNLPQLTSTEDEGFLENNLLSFTFPSPIPSSVSLAEGGASSDPGCLADDVIEELHSPAGAQLSEGGGVESPVQMLSYLTPNSQAEGQDSGKGASVCHLELPWLTGQGCRSPLVSSVSDSQLGNCCRCNLNSREGITKAPNVERFREEGTMTSRQELVDAAVQTVSPNDSLWGLNRKMSTSNMDSHSILGSPPGSRLNLRSSVGSNSNLVSPSSSMFPASSGEEEEKRGGEQTWNSASSHDLDRRRSCLKTHGEDRDELGRRSSMKQVQWDEDGMTWDVHGATLDPKVLTTAIQKHLELQSSPRPQRRSSKKKKAPKPPHISHVVKVMAPDLNPPAITNTSTGAVEGESKGTQETADRGREVEEGGGKKEETVEAACRISRAEGENTKEEAEVYGEEGTSHPKSPSRGSAHSRKKSVIKTLKRPGWCGSSRKVND
uniref:G protein-regulated inducer of neurite outgrowth C-terminal domain-containing protein n=1 Tax=Dicentrarchus labrax TaxID=13489 RepID=E6ZHT8_DICLA|nr:Uncharacterized protein [Dicentrarchus labrax]